MTSNFLSCSTGLLLLVLVGCHSNTTDHPPAKTTKATSQQPLAPQEAAMQGASSYETYRGRFATAPDSFTLHITQVPVSEGMEVEGIAAFYYGADGVLHELRERFNDSADSLLLGDSGPDAAPGQPEMDYTWHLHREARGQWAGRRAGQPLQLRRVSPAPEGLGFAAVLHKSTFAAIPGNARSPEAELNLQGLVPSGPAASKEVNKMLASNVLREERGDTLAGQPAPASLDALWLSKRKAFEREFRAGIAEIKSTSAEDAEGEMGSYAQQSQLRSTAHVMVHQPPLLSLALPTYSSGGAHGNLRTQLRSFDLRTGKALYFDDIFLPEARPQLAAILERHHRQERHMSATEPLNEAIGNGKMPVSTNVCLTPGGVLFSYSAYTIAPGTEGEIKLFVPLAELWPLLREGLPLPGGTGVAVR